MSIISNLNKMNYNIIDVSYKKLKINNLFLKNKFIIYTNTKKILQFKNEFLKNNVLSMNLKTNFIKTLFFKNSFSFLRGGSFFCIFINDLKIFLDIIKIIKNIEFYYSYEKSICNITNTLKINEEFNKYNTNYIYIQFIIKKIKIKIIVLLFLFFLTLIRYIK